jgi:hypothetical protein
LIGRRHGFRRIELQTEQEREIPEGGLPAELFSNWTMRCAVVSTKRRGGLDSTRRRRPVQRPMSILTL